MENILKIIKSKKIFSMSIIIVLIYIIFLIYFDNHFLFRTYINGVNISCLNDSKSNEKIENEISRYNLELLERDEEVEFIKGNNIDLRYNKDNEKIKYLLFNQNKYLWFLNLFMKTEYTIENSITFDENKLNNEISELNCFKEENIVNPINAKLIFNGESYDIEQEVYGNKLDKDKLKEKVIYCISNCITSISLENESLYINPDFTSSDEKVLEAQELMNNYIDTKIVYDFGNTTEILDSSIINDWLYVNENMKVIIDEVKVKEYVKMLEGKYNTLGVERNFKTSTGKEIIIKGGNYGFKINSAKEVQDIINSIEKSQKIMKEPSYSQKSICRNEDDDIGDTYVEVNISRQMIWFYKNGKLIVSGDIVTGNINKGNGTHLGIYELNYKQKDATLKGFGYSSKVKYWMPFDGNIGLHDASWRGSFGGDIYINNGTHGCVNLPIYIAKKIYEEIEPGTPIICYLDN